MDVLKMGQIGGKCKLDRQKLDEEAIHISPLQSWGPEIRNFQELPEPVTNQSKMCDVYIEKPTFIMKIDASKFKSLTRGKIFPSWKYLPILNLT